MTVTEDIAAWARTRPAWQQRLLHSLATGQQPDASMLEDVLLEVLAPSAKPSSEVLDIALQASGEEQVVLLALENCRGINALTDDNVLEFAATGVTVVYGDNGSGKSGYARLVKEVVGARHIAPVLPDVFEDPPDQPAATVRYAIAGDEQQHKYPGPADPAVRKVSFYDEHCGDAYLSKRSTLTYRPSALILLDGLIAACDRLRELLVAQISKNEAQALSLGLPPDTAAGAFVASLSAATTDQDIADATHLPADTADRHAHAAGEVARLQSSDAGAERTRLERLAAAYAAAADLVDSPSVLLGPTAFDDAGAEQESAKVAREAAAAAASVGFSEELPGVGAVAWRLLWEAARGYSVHDAYPDRDFPATHDGARCVLCQQDLSTDAAERLRRFDNYMTDTTQRDATRAEATVARRLQGVASLVVEPAAAAADIALIAADSADDAAAAASALLAAEQTREGAVAWLAAAGPRPRPYAPGDVGARLRTRAEELRDTAAGVDVAAFADALTAAQQGLAELEASMAVARSGDRLRAETARLRELAKLRAGLDSVSTSNVTAKSTQLTRTYASDVIKDQFTRETEQLKLRRVTMRDLGGKKGQLEQQPSLLGAKASGVSTTQVLSEGEQTALGLAGFFTEAEFDSSKSALVVDDPVTSLDHIRREHVARRLTELAQDRQVIVFTHDVVFVGELLKNADTLDVTVAPRTVERRGTVPGHIHNALPWKAKDFPARFADLEVGLQRMTKDRAQHTQEQWEEVVASWSGRLSELWERAVSTEILDQVYDRGTSEVRVLKFRILAAVTTEDNEDFQAGYGAVSKWARRHDKAPETNYVAPEPDNLQAELDRIRQWQSRVKKYR